MYFFNNNYVLNDEQLFYISIFKWVIIWPRLDFDHIYIVVLDYKSGVMDYKSGVMDYKSGVMDEVKDEVMYYKDGMDYMADDTL